MGTNTCTPHALGTPLLRIRAPKPELPIMVPASPASEPATVQGAATSQVRACLNTRRVAPVILTLGRVSTLVDGRIMGPPLRPSAKTSTSVPSQHPARMLHKAVF